MGSFINSLKVLKLCLIFILCKSRVDNNEEAIMLKKDF